jgi:uncharacterized protein (TIGR03067 family)
MRTCRLVLGALAVLCVAGLARADKKAETEQKKFRYVKVVNDGVTMSKDDLKDMVLIVTGDKGVVKKGDKTLFEGTSKMDMSKEPWTIDVTITAGEGKGKVMKGIMKMDGEKMVACWGKAGGKRPKKFKSTKGSGRVLEVLEEIK